MSLTRQGGVERFCWNAQDIPPGLKYVDVLPDFATTSTGEDGYYVLPNGFLGTFREQDGELTRSDIIMPVFGLKTPRATFVAIVTGMPYGFNLTARARQGRYTFYPRFSLYGQPAYDDIAIEYHLLAGS